MLIRVISWIVLALLIHLQHCQKCFLRNLHAPDFLHALLAFLLLIEQFVLTRDSDSICPNGRL